MRETRSSAAKEAAVPPKSTKSRSPQKHVRNDETSRPAHALKALL